MFFIPERAKLHIGMIILQCGNAGNHILMRTALNAGINKLVFLIYRTSIALFFLFPFAYFLERKDRPKLNTYFISQFFLLGLMGVVIVNGLYIIGLDNTSPILVSTVENAIPAVTFVLAAIFRLEEVNLKRKDGIAKVFGTLSCAIGATVISFYKGPVIYDPKPSDHQSLSKFFSLETDEGKNWIFGCFCVIIRCLFYSGWTIFQASIVKRYPARMTVTSFSFFFALLQFLAIAAFAERDLQAWKIQSQGVLISLFYVGIVPSALGYTIIIWVVERGGPMLATAYLPLQSFLVAIMASIFLHEEFYTGSVIGAVLIAVGLYLVVWGKIQETKFNSEKTVIPTMKDSNQTTSHDKYLSKPLLHTSSEP